MYHHDAPDGCTTGGAITACILAGLGKPWSDMTRRHLLEIQEQLHGAAIYAQDAEFAERLGDAAWFRYLRDSALAVRRARTELAG